MSLSLDLVFLHFTHCLQQICIHLKHIFRRCKCFRASQFCQKILSPGYNVMWCLWVNWEVGGENVQRCPFSAKGTNQIKNLPCSDQARLYSSEANKGSFSWSLLVGVSSSALWSWMSTKSPIQAVIVYNQNSQLKCDKNLRHSQENVKMLSYIIR